MNVSRVQAPMDQIEGYVAHSCQFRLSIDESYECSQAVYEENLCLFHAPKLSESDKQGLSEVERATVQATEREFLEKLLAFIAEREKGSEAVIDLRGFQFPRMKFPSVSKSIDFTGGVFAQSINFDSAEFLGEASFVFAQFPANSNFQSTAFRKEASFEQAIFGGSEPARITFLETVFDGGVNFNGAGFACEVEFSSSTFGKADLATFWDTSFMSHAIFADCVFHGHSAFRAKFHGEAIFRRTKFRDTRFAGSTFAMVADFGRCKFLSAAFSTTSFKGDARFEEAEFGGGANFEHCRFEQLARYRGVVFEQGVDFTDTKFLGDFTSFGCKYRKQTEFILAEFAGSADLRGCVFEDKVNFMTASFYGATRFSNSIFGGPVIFRNAKFSKEVQFVNDMVDYAFNDEVDFRDLTIGPDGRLIFRNINLEKARFTNTDLGLATFSNVKWFQQRHRLAPWISRKVSLWDEFNSVGRANRDEYECIAENYRQLVLNYEQKRDYETAESFHIGEMEMQRKKKGANISLAPLRKLRQWFNAYGAYRISSQYGTSYGQAILLLIVLVFLFSLGFLYSGFQTTTNNSRRTIEYNLVPDSSHHTVTVKEWFDDYLSALSLCMTVVTFQKDRFYEPMEGAARGWLFATVITLTGQAAMTLLALRRKFRR